MDPSYVRSGEEIVYQYDSLNRLASAVTTDNVNVSQWGQGYTYDGFANLTGKTVVKGSAPAMSVGVDAATNRLSGYSYDANGNQLSTGTQTLAYDYENRVVSAGNSSAGSWYGYDANNRRVYTVDWTYNAGTEVTTFTNETVYFYGADGRRMGAYALQVSVTPPAVSFTVLNARTYFGGKMIARDSGTVAEDRLGSVGKYYPYGEARASGASSFATYTRDAGGLDYAVNRYYSSGLGRFVSADPYIAGGGPEDPGSWNRYGYVGGDPVNYRDSSGLMREDCGPEWANDASLEGPCSRGEANGPFYDWGGKCRYAPSFGPSGAFCYVPLVAFAPPPAPAPRRPLPKYLKVTDDCYVRNSIENGRAERHITYELYADNDERLTSAVVTEHLTGDLPNTGATLAGLPGGVFEDTQSILLGKPRQQLTQTFTATTIYNYVTPPVVNAALSVQGFGGNFGTLSILKTPMAVFINGNSGLDA